MRRHALGVSVDLLLSLGLPPGRCSSSSGAQLAREASLVDASPTLVVTSAADTGPATPRRALLDARATLPPSTPVAFPPAAQPAAVRPGAPALTWHSFSLPEGGFLLLRAVRYGCGAARSSPSVYPSPRRLTRVGTARTFCVPGGWMEARS